MMQDIKNSRQGGEKPPQLNTRWERKLKLSWPLAGLEEEASSQTDLQAR